MRVIADRDASMHWKAWWNDMPAEYQVSASMLGAVAKLLISRGRGISAYDLVADPQASRPWHVEWAVEERQAKLENSANSPHAAYLAMPMDLTHG